MAIKPLFPVKFFYTSSIKMADNPNKEVYIFV